MFDTEAPSYCSKPVEEYANRRRLPLEFEVGDHVFLKVMPKRGVVRFGKQGKLALRYCRPLKAVFFLFIIIIILLLFLFRA